MNDGEAPMTSGQLALARVDKHEAVCEVRYTEIRDNIKAVGTAGATAAVELREAIRGTNKILIIATLSLIGVMASMIGVLVFYMITHHTPG